MLSDNKTWSKHDLNLSYTGQDLTTYYNEAALVS